MRRQYARLHFNGKGIYLRVGPIISAPCGILPRRTSSTGKSACSWYAAPRLPRETPSAERSQARGVDEGPRPWSGRPGMCD
jgi:hypothetical protein